MATKQPIWTFILNMGDASPLEHGGLFLYRDETNVYGFELEKVEPNDANGTFEVHRVCLDRLKPGQEEWFTSDLAKVAGCVGLSVEVLRESLESAEGRDLANAYIAIFDYHGWANGDEYPRTLTYAEALVRYQDDAIRPDGYHDCECCSEILMCTLLCTACVKAGCEARHDGDGHCFDDCQRPDRDVDGDAEEGTE